MCQPTTVSTVTKLDVQTYNLNTLTFWGWFSCQYIPTYFQQDSTLYSLFNLETALHVSGGTSTHHQERIPLYLQHQLLVRPLLLPAAIAAGSSNGLTNTRCCRYSGMRAWWWVEVPPETCTAVSRLNKLCNVA